MDFNTSHLIVMLAITGIRTKPFNRTTTYSRRTRTSFLVTFRCPMFGLRLLSLAYVIALWSFVTCLVGEELLHSLGTMGRRFLERLCLSLAFETLKSSKLLSYLYGGPKKLTNLCSCFLLAIILFLSINFVKNTEFFESMNKGF